MSSRPLIGITAGGGRTPGRPYQYHLNRAYASALEAAGGLPVVLVPGSDGNALLDRLDAILFSGGPDVEPYRYGQEPGAELDEVDSDRDELELPLAQSAIDSGMPLLAICRGHQLVNVALGGSLVQHLENPLHDNHAQPRDAIRHRVRLEEDSRLAAIAGLRELEVNSLHHQGVDRLAPGLVATGWSEDGLVEAYETRDGRVLSVQCHPEELTGSQEWARRLFASFVELAAQRRPAK